MEDGEPYEIYLFILFADEYQEKKSIKNIRSICGIFLVPVGVSHLTHGSLGIVRIMSLVPHYHDPNNALQIIIDDIVQVFIHEIPSIDVFGRRVRICLDRVGMFGDFVKVAAVSNNMDHSAAAFCTHFSIRKQTNCGPSRDVSEYSLTQLGSSSI